MLTLDSEPVNQDTGKQKIFTTLAIRLVLDRAATTQEAVELLDSYDMFCDLRGAITHFVTDAGGDSRVIEYDPEQEGRPLRWTSMQAITNFTAAMPTWCSQTREMASTVTERTL